MEKGVTFLFFVALLLFAHELFKIIIDDFLDAHYTLGFIPDIFALLIAVTLAYAFYLIRRVWPSPG